MPRAPMLPSFVTELSRNAGAGQSARRARRRRRRHHPCAGGGGQRRGRCAIGIRRDAPRDAADGGAGVAGDPGRQKQGPREAAERRNEMADDILVKQDGPILRITLNAPDRGNAVTDDMVRELTKMIGDAPKTSDIVVLRGAGKDFCVGRAGMGARPAARADRLHAAQLLRRGVRRLWRDAQLPDPDHRRGAGRRARLRLRDRGGLRHHHRQRQGEVLGAGDGAPDHADHGDVVVRRPRAAQGDGLSGLFDVRGERPSARCPTASSATWCRPRNSTPTSTSSPPRC